MAFKRSSVRSRLSPPEKNLVTAMVTRFFLFLPETGRRDFLTCHGRESTETVATAVSNPYNHVKELIHSTVNGDDLLELNNYNYSPSLVAIIQSGNLYVYVMLFIVLTSAVFVLQQSEFL